MREMVGGGREGGGERVRVAVPGSSRRDLERGQGSGTAQL